MREIFCPAWRSSATRISSLRVQIGASIVGIPSAKRPDELPARLAHRSASNWIGARLQSSSPFERFSLSQLAYLSVRANCDCGAGRKFLGSRFENLCSTGTWYQRTNCGVLQVLSRETCSMRRPGAMRMVTVPWCCGSRNCGLWWEPRQLLSRQPFSQRNQCRKNSGSMPRASSYAL